MPTINFKKNRPPIKVQVGSNLMKVLLESEIPVASSCGGDGICGKCKITLISGEKNLSPAHSTEILLKNRLSLEKNQRISCQCEILGDITIDAGYW